jgi:CRP-like cAMP-binding protein
VPAGQAVFRQGDPADRFYVIELGAADVVGDGRLVTTLGPEDGFGEIALLRSVPRTATVRAATDLELQALRCDRFLPVVTGYPPSSREAGPRSRRCSTDSARVNRLMIKTDRDTSAEIH